jgi:molybdopterin molybdotransferase
MISVEDALDRIVAALPDLGTETVPLAEAHGRVLAKALTATHSQPPFDGSAMDGYAVRVGDVVPGRPLRLAGTSQAGARFAGMMEHGQCVRIFTGAPLPIGADAVIMQEEAVVSGALISFARRPASGQNIRRKGNDFLEGAELLPAGTPIMPAVMTLAAGANRSKVEVRRRPRIALLATGDELVPLGTQPGPDQIVASNGYGIVPILRPHAENVANLGIAADSKRVIESKLLDAFDAGVDIIVTTGGASVGDRDYVHDVLVDLGVNLDFWKIAIRPGKPMMFGTRGKTLVFGLSGNPVSALVTATVILLPALRAMAGYPEPTAARFSVPLAAPLPKNGERRAYLRGKLQHSELGFLEVMPLSETDSAHTSSLARADALIVQLENDPGTSAGELVEVILL